MKSISCVLLGVAVLALLVGQVQAAPQVGSILMESDDYETVFAPLVSSTDIGDASNLATTATGGSFWNGENGPNMINGAIASCCDDGDVIQPLEGATLEIFLDTTASPLGYDITSLVNFSGWNSASRADHQYTIALRPVGGSYSDILTVNHDNNPHGENEGSMVTINDSGGGLLGTGIDALRYTFSDAQDGFDSFHEFDTFGSPTPEPSTLALLGVGALGLAVLAFRRRRRK